MKWLVGLVGVMAVAAFAVAAYVVLANRDPVPDDISACVRKAGLSAARSSDTLGTMRPDILAGRVTVRRRWDWGRTKGVLLAGPAGDYVVLALWTKDSPSLAGAGAPRRVYEDPATFPLVVLENPAQGQLVACAGRA